jgi:hypothetical protein
MGLNISQITIGICVRFRFLRWDKNTVATIGRFGTGMDNETAGPFHTQDGSSQVEEEEGNGREEPHALGVTVMTHLRSFDELALTDGRNREKFGNQLHKRIAKLTKTLLNRS